MTLIPLHPMDFYIRIDGQLGRCIVVFSASSCGSCRRLRQLLSQCSGLSVPCFEVNAEDARFLLEEYEVHHLPGVLCFEAGEYRHSITDLQSIETIEQGIWLGDNSGS